MSGLVPDWCPTGAPSGEPTGAPERDTTQRVVPAGTSRGQAGHQSGTTVSGHHSAEAVEDQIAIAMTDEQWSIVAAALWDYAKGKRRSEERRRLMLAARERIVAACGWRRS